MLLFICRRAYMCALVNYLFCHLLTYVSKIGPSVSLPVLLRLCAYQSKDCCVSFIYLSPLLLYALYMYMYIYICTHLSVHVPVMRVCLCV